MKYAMAISLKESQAVADMAQLLYDFLPGSGNPGWKGHVSYKSVAKQVGVESFWQPGSKLPMITALLEKTLEYRRDHFEQLILGIVRAGLAYRGKDRPIQPSEIERLNGHLLEVGFKFPDLWDPSFVGLLGIDSSERAKKRVDDTPEESLHLRQRPGPGRHRRHDHQRHQHRQPALVEISGNHVIMDVEDIVSWTRAPLKERSNYCWKPRRPDRG